MYKLVLLVITVCTFGISAEAQRTYMDGQDGNAYPGVVYVPLDAFRENRNTTRNDHTEIGSAIFNYCLKDQGQVDVKDWNTVRSNPDLSLNGIRYFITYSHHYDPETGTCSVTIDVYSGPEYDPKATKSLGTFHGSSQLGYTNFSGREVESEGECLQHAAAYAAKQLCSSRLFASGWETRPFPTDR